MPLVEEWHHLDLSEHPLDMLYLNGDKETFKQVLKDFKRNGGLKRYRLASDKSIEKVVKEIAGLDEDQISLSLYETYSENLRKAVDQVFTRESDSTLSDQLRANVSRFAAYKALLATREVQTQLAVGDVERAALAVKTYNRFQATEYNTTVSRCRTAKQFIKFDDPDSKRIFPNIRWIPSRSATPRESHKLFWNRIWPKDDPFWLTNTPGSIWNCKCDWEETDDEVTENNPQGENQCAQGLQGNPAETGEVFSDDHSYCNHDVSDAVKDQNTSLYDLMTANLKEWRTDYYNNDGGLLLSNKKRIKEGLLNRNEKDKFGKEFLMCKTLAENNYNIQYLESVEGSYDIIINGHPADLKKLESHNNILKKAKHAINQQGADIVIFEFKSLTSEILTKMEEIKDLKIKSIWFVSSEKTLHFINMDKKLIAITK